MDYKEELEDTVNRLLSGEWSMPKFQREFFRLYLEEVPGETLSVCLQLSALSMRCK